MKNADQSLFCISFSYFSSTSEVIFPNVSANWNDVNVLADIPYLEEKASCTIAPTSIDSYSGQNPLKTRTVSTGTLEYIVPQVGCAFQYSLFTQFTNVLGVQCVIVPTIIGARVTIDLLNHMLNLWFISLMSLYLSCLFWKCLDWNMNRLFWEQVYMLESHFRSSWHREVSTVDARTTQNRDSL